MSNIQEVKKQAQNTQLVTIDEYLKKNEHLIVRALNNTISPERFLAVISIVMQSSALQGCSQNSLVAAVLQTVQVGLTPGALAHVYYVPFMNKNVREVQMIIGFKGLIELVNRSKEASILGAECVFEKDQFQYEQGLNPVLRHIPAQGDRGSFVGVYAIAKNMLANEKTFVFLNKEEVQKVRNASKAGNSDFSPWVKWFDEMAKKTAIKRLCKNLPLSVEVQQKIATDETVKMEIAPKMTDVPDKTEWNAQEAEIVQPEAKHEALEAPASPDNSQSEAKPVSMADEPVGATVASFKGLVKSYKVRLVGKEGAKKEITDYMAEDENGVSFKITRWGSVHKGVENALCTFTNIVVGEWKNEKTYLASNIETEEEIAWKD